MALSRYRHFWSSELASAGIARNLWGHSDPDDFHDIQLDLANGANLAGILKAYEPPRFMREVRQVATGKYLNERILGRLDPEATNFTIVMPSEYERMYGYNADYEFEIVEELHDNENGDLMTLTDVAVGTLFDRESTRYEQGSADRDWTYRFILKTFKRTLALPASREHLPAITTGPADQRRDAVPTYPATISNTEIVLIDVNVPNGTFNFAPAMPGGTGRSMFGKNLGLPTPVATT